MVGEAMTRDTEQNRDLITRRDDLGAFQVLRELTHNGYAIDGADDRSSGIRLRHDSAPDLILHADGRVEVPLGQKRKPGITGLVPGVRRGMSWGRTLIIVVVLAIVWCVSAYLTATFLEMQ